MKSTATANLNSLYCQHIRTGARFINKVITEIEIIIE